MKALKSILVVTFQGLDEQIVMTKANTDSDTASSARQLAWAI